MFIRRLWNRATAPLQLFYWQLTLPEAEGAKLLITCDGKFLMIREAFGQKHWTLPGGRMKDHETPEDTARRKAEEEVGIVVHNPIYLGSYFHTRQYKKDAICVYLAKVKQTDHKPDSSSIIESGWFSLDEIAQLMPRSDSVDDAIELYRRQHG